jgi:hypothetical protein
MAFERPTHKDRKPCPNEASMHIVNLIAVGASANVRSAKRAAIGAK